MNKTKDKVIINKTQELYVIPTGDNGYSCLGFDVCIKRGKALAEEMGLEFIVKRGTITAYNKLQSLYKIAHKKHKISGWRSTSELYKPFIGHEGKRVEVSYNDGTKERFYIGKSTGYVPCHIMVKKINSSGGGAVLTDSIQSFKFIEGWR